MPTIDRRDFIKLVGAGGVGAGVGFVLAESIKHPTEHLIPYPVPPEEYSPGVATWYNSVCMMCAAGCGISVRTREGRPKKIEGNPAHPVNQGRLCALGQANLQVLYNPDRIAGPLVRDGDHMSSVTWEDGMARVADALRPHISDGRVAMLTGNARGHHATLFDAFMAELGSGRLLHYDFTASSSLRAANERVFGEAELPYYDIHNTNYLLSFGADFLGTWLSPVHHSLGYGHNRQGRRDGRARFVQIEARMSLSGAAADQWLPARPGSEGIIALGIARQIVSTGLYSGEDADAWAVALDAWTPDVVAERSGIDAVTIERIAHEFATANPGLAIGGHAVGANTNGVDALSAINALNYLAGNIGRTGGVVFNPPPVVGAEAARNRAGYSDMVALADDAGAGNIDVLIVSGANPVHTMPAASGFADALARVPMIVSLSSFMDDTTALAHVVLPSHTDLESWGDHAPEPGVGFKVAAISQPVVAPLFDTRPTGDIVLGLARELGLGGGLDAADMHEYIRRGWLDIYRRGGAADDDGFDEFWRSVLRAGVWGDETRSDNTSVSVSPDAIAPTGGELLGDDSALAFLPYLSHGFRDGRGANLPWMQELPDPMTRVVYGSWVELNPETARELGIDEGELVEISSEHGTISAPALIYPAIMPGVVAMPIGQGHGEFGRYARNRGANPLQIVSPDADAASGELAWSATRITLNPTGRRAPLLSTSGTPRDLGRDIVRTTGGNAHAKLRGIPITVERA